MEFKTISQKAYPSINEKESYILNIEKVEDPTLRKVLKLICCSGFRIGEVLNSYIYINETGGAVVRGIAEKKFKITSHKMFKRGFLGRDYLIKNLTSPIWKETPFLNIFSLNVKELLDEVSLSFNEPNFIFEGCTYHALYAVLKKGEVLEQKINYVISELENPKKIYMVPSFHFYRKLYASELKNYLKDPFRLLDVMKWESIKTALNYVRMYERESGG